MNFSEESQELMKYFLNDFEKYNEKDKPQEQKKKDIIFKKILNDINNANDFIKKAEKINLIKRNVKEIFSKKDFPSCSLLDNKYIPKNISNYIKVNSFGYMKTTTLISGININIYFMFFKKSDFNHLKNIEKKINYVLKIIKFLSYYLKNTKIKKMDIFLFLTKFKKELPKNQISTLSQDNCNSAVTYACAEEGELLLYREEEWKKVLIHELMHSFCLDFSGISYSTLKTRIKNIFDIKSDFEISEAYCEYWATVINCAFISYELLYNKKDIENFCLYITFCIQMEKIFSLFQCVKVLNYMSLIYENLYKNDSISISFRSLLYKEETNVFSYYILKLILLYFNTDFLLCCSINNDNIIYFDKTPQNIKKIGNFFEKYYDRHDLLEKIKKMEIYFKKISGSYIKPNKYLVNKTMRMTICEID